MSDLQRYEWSDALVDASSLKDANGSKRVNAAGRNVGLAIARHADWTHGDQPELRMSTRKVSYLMGISRNTFKVGVRELVSKGFLVEKVGYGGNLNFHMILPTDMGSITEQYKRNKDNYTSTDDPAPDFSRVTAEGKSNLEFVREVSTRAGGDLASTRGTRSEAPLRAAEPEPAEGAPAPPRRSERLTGQARDTSGLSMWEDHAPLAAPQVEHDGETTSNLNNEELESLTPKEARQAFKETVPAGDVKPGILDGWF